MKYLPLERIRQTLFQTTQFAEKIRKQYRIEDEIVGEQLEKRVFELLGQQQHDPLEAHWTNNQVFEKAVLALGSNSRPWGAFLATLPQLRTQLSDFDVSRVSKWVDELGIVECVNQLRRHLQGQTSRGDARGILRVAQILAKNPAYYERLRTAYFFVKKLSGRKISEPAAAASLCVALLLGNARYASLAARFSITKLPGMGVTLACEFLRNMGWSGFKPDRHVTEMMQIWYGDLERQNLESDIAEISRIFGRIAGSDLPLLRTSLLGARETPPGTPINQADQLVWLYRSTLRRPVVEEAERRQTEEESGT
jgi:hypothetical protein